VEAGTEGLLAEAQAAVAAGDWVDARRALEAALELEESGEALFGLSNALWWLGETEASVRYRHRPQRRRAEANRQLSGSPGPSAITAWTIGVRGGGALLAWPDGAPASSFAPASALGDGTFVRGVLTERERGSKRMTEAA
jgi:hypothetical protein